MPKKHRAKSDNVPPQQASVTEVSPVQTSSKTSDLAKNALGALIGVIATVVVGDLMVKRNYDAAIEEYRMVDEAIATAEGEFDDLVRQVDASVAERRGAAQMLSNYAASGNVNGFRDYYDSTYKDVVRHWNEVAPGLSDQIRAYTQCAQQPDRSPEVLANSTPPGVVRQGNPAVLSPREISTNQLVLRWQPACPDSLIYTTRDYATISKDKAFLSVFEVFRYMHELFVDSRTRPIVTCYAAAGDIQQSVLRQCRPLAAKLIWQSLKVSAAQCLQVAGRVYEPRVLCPEERYQELADFTEDRFGAIDYRWKDARLLLLSYRAEYVIRRCRSVAGFWSNFRVRSECRAQQL